MRHKIILYPALALIASARIVSAEVISFDDLPGDLNSIPNGYAGLNWDGFNDINPSFFGFDTTYGSGVVSGPNAAFNEAGQEASFSSATPFDLNSAYLTAVYHSGLSIEVQGWNGATELYDVTNIVSRTGPTQYTFDFDGVTSVDFITKYNGSGGLGSQMTMDDVDVTLGTTQAPDGGTTGLMLGGALVSLGWLRRKVSAPQK